MRGQDHKTDAYQHFSTEKASKQGPGDGPATINAKADLVSGYTYYTNRSNELDEFLSGRQKWLLAFGLLGNMFLYYFMKRK